MLDDLKTVLALVTITNIPHNNEHSNGKVPSKYNLIKAFKICHLILNHSQYFVFVGC